MLPADLTRTRPVRRGLLALLLGACATAALAQPAFDLAQLFALLAGHPRLSATFTEQKYIKGLEAPVESSGELLFEAPARMVRRTLQPRAETLLLDGDQATVARGQRSHTVSLADHPEIAVHVEGLRACLAGDLATLQRLYRVTLSGTAEHWLLTLVPRDPQAAAEVQSIALGGEQAAIRSVRVLLRDGDSSLTRIAPPQVPR